jgi:hypothetical protein
MGSAEPRVVANRTGVRGVLAQPTVEQQTAPSRAIRQEKLLRNAALIILS